MKWIFQGDDIQSLRLVPFDDTPPPPPPPGEAPALTVTVDEDRVSPGTTVDVSWTSERADVVTFDGVAVRLSGSIGRTPAATTTYSLVATNTAGSVERSVTVTVVEPPPPPPPPPAGTGLWIDRDRLMSRPTSGPAWDSLDAYAQRSWGSVDWTSTHGDHDVYCLAGAFYAACTSNPPMLEKVRQGLRDAMTASSNLRKVHQLARPLYGYIVAADLIDYRTAEFLAWVREMCETPIDGHSGTKGIRETARKIANNHGTAAHAALTAAGVFLNDDEYKLESVDAHLEYIGEPTLQKLMIYTDTSWHADAANKCGLNRKGSTRDGHSIDGVLPEDVRRGSFDFTWPPPGTSDRLYFYTGIEPVIVSAVILHRAGLLDWNSGDRAIERAYRWAYDVVGWPAEGDDTWQPPVVNYYSGTNFPVTIPSRPGKGMGYGDWTHGS